MDGENVCGGYFHMNSIYIKVSFSLVLFKRNQVIYQFPKRICMIFIFVNLNVFKYCGKKMLMLAKLHIQGVYC